MVKKLIASAVCFTLLSVFSFMLLSFLSTRRFEGRQQKARSAFASAPTAFKYLSDSWQRLPLKMDHCGRPELSPGLVHYAVLARTEQGKIRIGLDPIFTNDGFDATVASTDEAAKLLAVKPEALSSLLTTMDSLSITGIYQHDAELHFIQDDDASMSLMYVSPDCPQYFNYPFWNAKSNGGALTPFDRIEQLAPSWFLVEDKR